MTTHFDKLEKHYRDVETKGGINTKDFLKATNEVLKLFDSKVLGFLGGTAFYFVKIDLKDKIDKVKNRYDRDPKINNTLENLVKNVGKKDDATISLLWLRRGLKFVVLALRNSMENKSQNISVSFSNAYDRALAPHHLQIIRPVVRGVIKLFPNDLFDRLGNNQEEVFKKCTIWTNALDDILCKLHQFYIDNNYEQSGYPSFFSW